MKIIAREKPDQNRAVFDPWTIVHFGAGLAAGLVDMPLRLVLPVAIVYEIAEYNLESYDVGQELFETSGPEVIPNAIVDVAVFAAGHELGRRWNETG